MDANKRAVLQSIGYRVAGHCGTCRYADLSPDGWGYCDAHTYEHRKHSERRSRLSIHRAGRCPRYELDHGKLAALGLHAFLEFCDEG